MKIFAFRIIQSVHPWPGVSSIKVGISILGKVGPSTDHELADSFVLFCYKRGVSLQAEDVVKLIPMASS